MIEVISRPIGIGGKISEVLENIDTWSFNIFELEEVTQGGVSFFVSIYTKANKSEKGRPLYYLGMHFYEIYNFKVLYQIEEAKMSRFLEKVESSYKVSLSSDSSTTKLKILRKIYTTTRPMPRT